MIRRLARRLHELVSHDASRRAHLARREAAQRARQDELREKYPDAFAIPIETDESIPPGTVELRHDGQTIGRITGIEP